MGIKSTVDTKNAQKQKAVMRSSDEGGCICLMLYLIQFNGCRRHSGSSSEFFIKRRYRYPLTHLPTQKDIIPVSPEDEGRSGGTSATLSRGALWGYVRDTIWRVYQWRYVRTKCRPFGVANASLETDTRVHLRAKTKTGHYFRVRTTPDCDDFRAISPQRSDAFDETTWRRTPSLRMTLQR